MLLNYRRFRTLYEAARLGTMSAASVVMNVAPSSISRQINQLEKDLNIALVEKGVRRIKLTEAGEAACEFYQEKAADEELFLSQILDLKNVKSGKIVIAIGEAFISDLLVETVRQFMRDFPGITVIVHVGGTREVIDKVKEDKAHMGLIFDIPRDARIRSRLTLHEPLNVISRPKRSLSRKQKFKMTELRHEKMGLSEQSYRIRQVIQDAERQSGVVLNTALETNSLMLMLGIVLSGQGMTILPNLLVKDYLLDGRMISIQTDSDILNETKFTLITRLGRQLPVGANKFLTMLEAHLVQIASKK